MLNRKYIYSSFRFKKVGKQDLIDRIKGDRFHLDINSIRLFEWAVDGIEMSVLLSNCHSQSEVLEILKRVAVLCDRGILVISDEIKAFTHIIKVY